MAGLWLAGCAAAAPVPSPAGERVVEAGGELAPAVLPARMVTVEGPDFIASGWVEVPGDSRLPAALVMADAAARAELLKAVRVGVAQAISVRLEDRNGASSTEAESVTAQVASGVLPGLAPPIHGWRKVERQGELTLQVLARLTANREAVVSALARALGDRPDSLDLAKRAAGLVGQETKSP